MDDSLESIEAAIMALEAQRSLLGNAVVEMAVAPLREKLLAAQARVSGSDQQLKAVTVLFMDVVGSTELSRQLDPEDVHAVMDGALERLTAIVEGSDGRVLQYAGDSLLAVFGADRALEDDPERAVRAGLAILAEAPRLAERFAAMPGIGAFALRVGINTGPVLLGGGVDAQGSIRGITVNVAARMEQTAPPGGLRISHDTYRHVRGMFEVSEVQALTVKGIAEPVRSYLVLGKRQRSFKVSNRGIEGVETRMVGRDAELARLTDTFLNVSEEGAMALITVVADAGMGKSRLLAEFDEWLARQSSPIEVFHARPQPYGNSVPYGLLRDLLARRFDILDGDSQALAQTKLTAGFMAVMAERAAEHTALVGELIGLEFHDSPHIAGIVADAKQIRDRAFHALSQYFCFVQHSIGASLVLLLDDLHWADDGSLDYINHLAQTARDLPVFVLCLTRASLYERRPLWGSGQSEHERIDLAPLSRRGSRELVDALLCRLDAVPAALRDLLTSSAEGNPYFVEELVSMMIDNGVIVTGPERWHVVAEKLMRVDVPPTLAGVLQARLDGLPPAEKTALQQASVVGHVFWDKALQRIAPAATDSLAALMRRDLTHGRETSVFEGTREFVFKHHVLHQVTYDSVLKRAKREQHRQTAEWLVVRSGDRASEYFGLIAEHYERAGDTHNAIDYLRRAGEDAARSYAHPAALDYLGRALALAFADDRITRSALLFTRCSVLSHTGQRLEQEADVAALELLADEMDDDVQRARVAGLRTSHALVTGDYPAAAVAAAKAVAWADAGHQPAASLSARINWARALQFQGDYAGALEHMGNSLGLAREAGDHRVESMTLTQLGILEYQRGHYGVARIHLQQALTLTRRNGDRGLESGAINNLGDVERLLGNYNASFELLQAGQRLCREIGQRMVEGYLLCTMSYAALMQGNSTESLDLSTQALVIAERLKDRDLQASLLCTRGHAHSVLKQPDEARRCYRESIGIYREIGRPTMPPEPIAGLARLELSEGAEAEAVQCINEILLHLDAGGTVDGTEDPLWIYLTCHQVLTAAKKPRAQDLLETAHAMLHQRAEPLGPVERETFLGRVPSHRAIVEAWAAGQH